MRVIHKKIIDITVAKYTMPMNAVIIQFCYDGAGTLCIWYMFDRNENIIGDRNLYVYGTGIEIDDSLHYLASAVCGPFVWHLFEDGPLIDGPLDNAGGDMEGSAFGDHLRESM